MLRWNIDDAPIVAPEATSHAAMAPTPWGRRRTIVDSSALTAIVVREPGWDGLLERILSTPDVTAGTPTLAETGIPTLEALQRLARLQVRAA